MFFDSLWLYQRSSRLQFLYDAGAVAVSRSVDTHPLQHRQPHVAQGRVLRQSQMLAQLDVGSAAGENRWTIGEVMDGADV